MQSSCGAPGGETLSAGPARCAEGIPRDTMERVDRAALEIGWQAAVERFFPNEAGEICGERQAAFRHIWDLPPEAAILVLGDGWGTQAAALAGTFSRVAVVEPRLECAQFVGIRARQMNLPIHAVCAAAAHLPLAAGQFDAALLYGLPRTLAAGAKPANRKAYVRFLGAVRETLKPCGFACLIAENRLGWHNLSGRSSRMTVNNGSALRLYSLQGYLGLLHDAGYRGIRAFHIWDGRRNPDLLVPLNNRKALVYFTGLDQSMKRPTLRGRIRYFALRLAARTGVWAQCAPEVLVQAGRG